MPETVHTWNALYYPGGTDGHVTSSVRTLLLDRDASGAVIRSRRARALVPDPWADTEAHALKTLRELVRALDGQAPGQLQTATAMVRSHRSGERAPVAVTGRTLARMETAAGPVLLGAPWDAPVPDARTLPTAGDSPGEAPADWAERPLVLAPPTAAVVLSALRLALDSPTGRRLRERYEGRPLCAPLTLTDLSALHPEGGTDDAGTRARPLALVRDGALVAPEPGPGGQPWAGRLAWDHDEQATAPPGVARLALTGLAVPAPEAIRLTWCVEHLRRYQSDGTVRLTCVALDERLPGRWFRLGLRAQPVALLRRVKGLTGAVRQVFSDDEVSTPGLLLPAASQLNHSKGLHVERI